MKTIYWNVVRYKNTHHKMNSIKFNITAVLGLHLLMRYVQFYFEVRSQVLTSVDTKNSFLFGGGGSGINQT
jgi:hypothetical protein